MRRVFSGDEIQLLQRDPDRLLQHFDLIDSANIRCRWQNHVETGECRFDCFDPVIDFSEAFAGLARDERIIRAVSAVYGEPACLFKKTDLQASWGSGLRAAPGLHFLWLVSGKLHHCDRSH